MDWENVATYVYDETNHMVEGKNEQGEYSLYTYNGLGVRVARELIMQDNTHGYTDFHKETPSVDAGITKAEVVKESYVIDYTSATFNPLTMDEAGGFNYRYVYGLDRLSVKITSEGTNWWGQNTTTNILKDYYHQDRMGSTTNMTDTYGRVVGRADYNEWGQITYRDALNITSSYRRIYPQLNYTGHDWDDVLGMYYAKARFYSADDKRFVAMDPVKGNVTDPLSLVSYLYCVDNPLRYVDPLGLMIDGGNRPTSKNLASTYDDGNGGGGSSDDEEESDIKPAKQLPPLNKGNNTNGGPTPVIYEEQTTPSQNPPQPAYYVATMPDIVEVGPNGEYNVLPNLTAVPVFPDDGPTVGNNTPISNEEYIETAGCPNDSRYVIQDFYGNVSGPRFNGIIGANMHTDTSVTHENYIGLQLAEVEVGVLKLGYDGDFVDLGMGTFTADMKAEISTKYIGVEVGARLLESSIDVKVLPIPFTKKALSVGLRGELGAVGAEARWDWKEGVAIGVSLFIGGQINVNIVDR